jgi:PiT family inorganic phosphate transporter
VELETRQGLAAEAATATVILLSSHFGYSLSTTHVATGSVLGSGVGKKGARVRWSVAGRMFTAWLVTVPAAGSVGAACYGLDRLAGTYVVVAFLIVAAGLLYAWSRLRPVNHTNVNDAWEGHSDATSTIGESIVDHDPTLLSQSQKDHPEPMAQR